MSYSVSYSVSYAVIYSVKVSGVRCQVSGVRCQVSRVRSVKNMFIYDLSVLRFNNTFDIVISSYRHIVWLLPAMPEGEGRRRNCR